VPYSDKIGAKARRTSVSLTNTPTNAPPLFVIDELTTFLGHSDLSRSTRYRISL